MSRDKRAQRLQMNRRRRELVQSDAYRLRQAADWPITSCLLSERWTEPESLIQIVLTRMKPATDRADKLAVGVYLLDPACLGLKNTFVDFPTPAERREILGHIESADPLAAIDPGIAVGLIRRSIDYARSLGFEPQQDFRNSELLLSGVEPADVSGQLRLGGLDGKPHYIQGPEDDVDSIINRLTARLGPDGFNYTLHLE